MPSLTVQAPLAGWCAPLAEVPDPVFAEGMIGDGLAIDPVSGIVLSPCDGEVVALPVGGHAVSVRAAPGVDVLVHVGIDSVRLGGRGFQPLVCVGQRVGAGEELMRFDLDVVARGAKSLVTPVLLIAAEGARIRRRHAPGRIRAGEMLLEVDYASVAAGGVAPLPVANASRTITISLRHGLHARPAALLAKRARLLDAQVSLAAHGKAADARSVTAIMALGVRRGEVIEIIADGAGAARAVDAVVATIDEALRMERITADEPASAASEAAPERAVRESDGVIPGVVAVPGFAVGQAARLERAQVAVTETGKGAPHEVAELERARGIVRARLLRVSGAGGATRREIVDAHLAFLDDPLLNEVAHEHIAAGRSAGFAWRAAIKASIASLEGLADARMRERADDLLDVESHVLLALAGEARPMSLALPEGSVVVADDLLPSELVALDRAHLEAICLSGGGPTSHVAILAAAMDVPMLVGLGAALRDVRNGQRLIVDGQGGLLHVAPSARQFAAAEQQERALRRQREADRQAAQRECRTRDGTRIEIFANLGSVAEAEAATAAGAEGCGLLRTEFLFIDRDMAPTEEEQLDIYQGIATALGGRPLVLRLMDVGGDKPLSYLPLPAEENPALGLRGVRAALRHPELLRTQLRAALRVKPHGVVRILVPMVTDVADMRAVRTMIEELQAELGGRASVEIGAMIETPAAALTADRIAEVADFFSIGSNDLTQYSLAMDRGHPELARRIDALHPAVLKLIALAASAGERRQRVVAVCGGMAADPAAVPLLIGLGVRELSVVPAAVAAIKRQIRELDVNDCASLAAKALGEETAADVRALVARAKLAVGGPS